MSNAESHPTEADRAGLDGHILCSHTHAYILNTGLQIKNRIKPDTGNPADTLGLSQRVCSDSTVHKTREPSVHSYVVAPLHLEMLVTCCHCPKLNYIIIDFYYSTFICGSLRCKCLISLF